ncbi:MAG TPA: UDP-N-acetylmuramyl-tripeptide synthetase [Candidatus Saccharimonadales bacterium]|nr:UDP-N-acetylmuramyl-tripeptide synthetase [Candidatus Saccharimonadales bacterium]
MWQRVKNVYHLGVAVAANVYYGFPGRDLTVIAVTGTDGKTTTTNLIYHILKTSGKEVSMISTVGAVIHGQTSPLGFHITNPSSFPLQKFLKAATSNKKLNKKNNYLVLEITSHGIDQFRIWGIPITLGLITNITEEHLDYHRSYQNYAKTKTKLLNLAKIRIFNRDDKSYSIIKQQLRQTAKNEAYTFGLTNKAEFNPNTIGIKINWELYNTFTKYNILAAISACSLISNLNKKDVEIAVETFIHPTGRQDVVCNKLFTVMIDFAHTPNSFENILSSINKNIHHKIIHVFGSAGKRDASKRPIMGKVSSHYADRIILTSEDPRTEDVREIMKDIRRDMEKKSSLEIYEIPDRQEAITKAIAMAQKGDFVLITGKAHEKSMNYGKGEEPWDEYEAVKKGLAARGITL